MRKRAILAGPRALEPSAARKARILSLPMRSRARGDFCGGAAPLIWSMVATVLAAVMREQETVDVNLRNTTLKARGRHDPCVLPRAAPMVEAMAALVLVDHALRQRAQCG